ncbi:hypothetical protein DQF64_04715 [Moraxella bovis]|nr:hypothetical protein DQF64_04715 [Moraxella bovis]
MIFFSQNQSTTIKGS